MGDNVIFNQKCIDGGCPKTVPFATLMPASREDVNLSAKKIQSWDINNKGFKSPRSLSI
jgi:hypothetical protein